MALPALTHVNGGLDVESTAPIDCSIFRSKVGTVVQGPFLCRTSGSAAGDNSSTPTFLSSSSSATFLSATIPATASPISTSSNASYAYPNDYASQSNLWTGVKVGLGVILPLVLWCFWG